MKSGLLKSLRNNFGVSQKDFAFNLNVSQQTVASWEVGRTEPSNDALIAIANYFNVSTDYLLGNERNNSHDFSDDEKRLINEYRKLDVIKKQTLSSMLAFLISPQNTTSGNVIQNTQNGHVLYSNSGNNIVMG